MYVLFGAKIRDWLKSKHVEIEHLVTPTTIGTIFFTTQQQELKIIQIKLYT